MAPGTWRDHSRQVKVGTRGQLSVWNPLARTTLLRRSEVRKAAARASSVSSQNNRNMSPGSHGANLPAGAESGKLLPGVQKQQKPRTCVCVCVCVSTSFGSPLFVWNDGSVPVHCLKGPDVR